MTAADIDASTPDMKSIDNGGHAANNPANAGSDVSEAGKLAAPVAQNGCGHHTQEENLMAIPAVSDSEGSMVPVEGSEVVDLEPEEKAATFPAESMEVCNSSEVRIPDESYIVQGNGHECAERGTGDCEEEKEETTLSSYRDVLVGAVTITFCKAEKGGVEFKGEKMERVFDNGHTCLDDNLEDDGVDLVVEATEALQGGTGKKPQENGHVYLETNEVEAKEDVKACRVADSEVEENGHVNLKGNDSELKASRVKVQENGHANLKNNDFKVEVVKASRVEDFDFQKNVDANNKNKEGEGETLEASRVEDSEFSENGHSNLKNNDGKVEVAEASRVGDSDVQENGHSNLKNNGVVVEAVKASRVEDFDVEENGHSDLNNNYDELDAVEASRAEGSEVQDNGNGNLEHIDGVMEEESKARRVAGSEVLENGHTNLKNNDGKVEIVKASTVACSEVHVEREDQAECEVQESEKDVAEIKNDHKADENQDNSSKQGMHVEESVDNNLNYLNSAVDHEDHTSSNGLEVAGTSPIHEVSPTVEKAKFEVKCNLNAINKAVSLEKNIEENPNIFVDQVDNLQSEVCGSCPKNAMENGTATNKQVEIVIFEGPNTSKGIAHSPPNLVPELEEIPDAPGGRPKDNRLFLYIAVVPHFNFTDEVLEEKLQQARDKVEEKEKLRDSFTCQLRVQKSVVHECREKLAVAREEENFARSVLNAKLKELDDIQMANEINDVAEQIRSMENTIQHDTQSLKQEKMLIKELKKLRQRHDSLCLKVGPKSDCRKTSVQKDRSEEHLKLLRKEIHTLRIQLSTAECKAKDAYDEHNSAHQCAQYLQKCRNEAQEMRQQEYEVVREIKKTIMQKNKHFYQFKDDYSAAIKFKTSGDKEGLRNHCTNQVENFMKLWNDNEEFRTQYIKFNETKTPRRFDGGSVGPLVESSVLPKNVENPSRAVAPSSSASSPVLPPKISEKSLAALSTGKDNSSPVLPPEISEKSLASLSTGKDNVYAPLKVAQANQSATSRKLAKSNPIKPIMISTSKKGEEAVIKDKSIIRQEEELKRQEDERRKAKAAAELKEKSRLAAVELKEKCRLEEIAKAKEAEERKKRRAGKAQARAEYKAQKEAEEKEKKKAKKEKRRLGSLNTSGNSEGNVASSVAMVNTPEVTEENETSVTRTTRNAKNHPSSSKSAKVQPLPLLLRNRARRKMKIWILAFVALAAVLVLIAAGGYYISV